MSAPASRPANRLAREKSPYLLQHAHNPVDWHPWGEEAFAKAKKEGKPIFLSIGYSTCHWCHVMERESFESEAIAAALNERFVPVKVDREERPDVDRIYMAYVQAVTGSGGWPLSVFLTPDLEPFYGGTYFPPFAKHGRPGFAELLRGVDAAWRERREEIATGARRAIEQMREQASPAPGDEPAPGEAALRRGAEWFARSFDERHGGFGGAPKFPRPSSLLFLFRWHRRAGDAAALHQAARTLRAMAAGGIHDHLGGGFHRYSVDARWHVPHFEKMLYDQGQLAVALAEGWLLTKDPLLERALRGTCDYVLRDLLAPEGAFYSAEDADSAVPGGDPNHPEKREGAYYVFTAAEVRAACGPAAAAVSLRFGVEEGGNCDDPHGELTGTNVLFAARELDEVARSLGVSAEEAARQVAEGAERLRALRATRPRPHLDDKILAGWNGLMISGLAAAGRALGEPRYLEAAERAARFVATAMREPKSGELLRRYRAERARGAATAPAAGDAGIRAQCDDYAFFVQGLLDLFDATLDPKHLDLALALASKQDQLFHDAASGAWFGSAEGDPSILVRLIEDYDGAEPAPTSVAARNALRLAERTGDETQRSRGEAAVRAFAARIGQIPAALPQMLVAADALAAPPVHVAIAGTPGAPDTEALLAVARGRFLPHAAVLLLDGGERQEWLAARLPFVAGMKPVGGRAAAYVCVNRACRLPVTAPDTLARLLDEAESPPASPPR